MTTAYQGDPYQTPLTYRTRASRQTEATQPAPRSDPRRAQSRQPFVADEDDNPGVWEEARPHTSARRYDLPQRQSGKTTTWLSPKPTRKMSTSRHANRGRLLVILGSALLFMLFGFMALSWLGSWWQGVTDNWQYGLPRTFQTDHYVGQGDSPQHPDHFLALNVAGQVEVIQLNPRNPQLDHIYGITTTDDPSNPVTLSFPLADGKQEMYVSIGDSNPYTVRLVSDGKEFIAPGQH